MHRFGPAGLRQQLLQALAIAADQGPLAQTPGEEGAGIGQPDLPAADRQPLFKPPLSLLAEASYRSSTCS